MKWLVLLLMCAFARSYSQEVSPPVQQQLENIAEETDTEMEGDDHYLQQLEFLQRHPMNLNEATREGLIELRLLTDLQIESFLRYLRLCGRLVNIYELQAVPLWDLLSIRRILPYVVVKDVFDPGSVLSEFWKGRHSVLLRSSLIMEKAVGFDRTTPNSFIGGRDHSLIRYRYQFKNLISMGFTGEKDAGESLTRNAVKGFDFYSFHLYLKKKGILNCLALGDYTINLGQGLLSWQSLGFGKSQEVLLVKRQANIILPYRSSSESNFRRGIAVAVSFGSLQLAGYVSLRKLGGSVDTLGGLPVFTSINSSGLHRTMGEWRSRSKILEREAGMVVQWSYKRFRLSINSLVQQFDKNFEKKEDPYNSFAFRGSKLLQSSVDYHYTYNNIHLFGETAIDKDLHSATINGCIVSVNSRADMVVMHRNFSRSYQTLSGNALGESSLPQNEGGFYFGFSLRPALRWTINFYSDHYWFQWLRYRVSDPSSGRDYLLSIKFQPNRQTELYILYKSKHKPLNSGVDSIAIDAPLLTPRHNLRVHYLQKLSTSLEVRSRVEYCWRTSRHSNSAEGLLVYVDIISSPYPKLDLALRWQFFETDDYETRLYAFELNFASGFSVPASSGSGSRAVFNLRYKPAQGLVISVRLAKTALNQASFTGSGLERINRPSKTEFGSQISLEF